MTNAQELAALQAHDKNYHLHPFTDPQALKQAPPFVIESASGSFVTGQGMKLLDAMAGLGCVNIGYGRREMAQTAARVMEDISYYHSFAGVTNPYAAELAATLCDLAPGMERVFFANSGSEANETALKLVRMYWQRKGKPDKRIIISRDMSYHGTTLATSALNGLTAMHTPFDIQVEGMVKHAMTPFWYRFGGDASEADFAQIAAQSVDDAILEAGPENVAAFIGEPVQGTLGAIIPPEGYWPAVQAICKKHDVLLIADEVVTGLGRTGQWFAQETFGFQADLMTLAKGLSSGYQPISALLMSGEFIDVIEQEQEVLQHGFTTSAHPVAAAVALKNIEILKREGLVDRIATDIGPFFREKLKTLEAHPLVGEVRTCGLIAAVELAHNKETRAQYPYEWGVCGHVGQGALTRGLIVRPAGNVVLLYPPFTLSKGEVGTIADVLLAALDDTKVVIDDILASGNAQL